MSAHSVRALGAAALVVVSVACGDPAVPPSAPEGAADPSSASGFRYRGVHHVSWWHDQYTYAEAGPSRGHLAATQADWAGVLVTGYMAARDASEVGLHPQRTPTDEALALAIRDLRGRGLRVMLKPHVDVLDGTWRGAIAPSDVAAWFASYTAFITHYARLAEAEGAEMFCVGTELATLSDTRYAREWGDLIAAVRARYGGLLTYAANAVGAADEFTSVAFWDRLDVAGLDPYTPLTARRDPTVGELAAGWSRNRHGDDMVSAFRRWQASHGKPVVFTELGYRSVDGAASAPWDFETSASYDPGEQADAYEAAFRVWSQEPWMGGIFWWAWPVMPPGARDTDYTPRDKPAESVLRRWHR